MLSIFIKLTSPIKFVIPFPNNYIYQQLTSSQDIQRSLCPEKITRVLRKDTTTTSKPLRKKNSKKRKKNNSENNKTKP